MIGAAVMWLMEFVGTQILEIILGAILVNIISPVWERFLSPVYEKILDRFKDSFSHDSNNHPPPSDDNITSISESSTHPLLDSSTNPNERKREEDNEIVESEKQTEKQKGGETDEREKQTEIQTDIETVERKKQIEDEITEREKLTKRQTDGETVETEKQVERATGSETVEAKRQTDDSEKQTERPIDSETFERGKQTDGETDSEKLEGEKQAESETERETIETEKQAQRETDSQTVEREKPTESETVESGKQTDNKKMVEIEKGERQTENETVERRKQIENAMDEGEKQAQRETDIQTVEREKPTESETVESGKQTDNKKMVEVEKEGERETENETAEKGKQIENETDEGEKQAERETDNNIVKREKQTDNETVERGRMDCLTLLPEVCISNILSLTSPRDVCRFSAISWGFKSAADSNVVWEKFLPSDYWEIISRSVTPLGAGAKKQIYFSLHQSPAPFDGVKRRRSLGMSRGVKTLTDDSDTVKESFLPLASLENVSSSISHVALFTKKELFFRLSDRPILLDGGKLSFALDKESGKKCYMIGARSLTIMWGSSPKYWEWKSFPQSRFSEVANLLAVCELDIRGRLETQSLSPKTTYVAYLVFKISLKNHGIESLPVKAGVKFVGERSRNNTEDESSNTVFLKVRTSRSLPRIRNARLPQKRMDGWMEIALGEFFNDQGSNSEVEMVLTEIEQLNWKSGLIVEGIELRPKVDAKYRSR